MIRLKKVRLTGGTFPCTALFCVTLLLLPFAYAAEKPALNEEPFKAARMWNDALYDGNIGLAEQHTSSSSQAHIKKNWGSLSGLSKIFQANLKNRSTCIHKNTSIEGNRASVETRCLYKDGSVKDWEDTLFLEGGKWKLAPQFAKSKILLK